MPKIQAAGQSGLAGMHWLLEPTCPRMPAAAVHGARCPDAVRALQPGNSHLLRWSCAVLILLYIRRACAQWRPTRGERASQAADGGLSDGLEGDYYGGDEDERIFPFELEMLEGALMVATGGSGRSARTSVGHLAPAA